MGKTREKIALTGPDGSVRTLHSLMQGWNRMLILILTDPGSESQRVLLERVRDNMKFFRGKSVHVLAVSPKPYEEIEQLKRELNLAFTVLADPRNTIQNGYYGLSTEGSSNIDSPSDAVESGMDTVRFALEYGGGESHVAPSVNGLILLNDHFQILHSEWGSAGGIDIPDLNRAVLRLMNSG